jgi:DNA-binding response OmpR family regulator
MERILFIDDNQDDLDYYYDFLCDHYLVDLEREAACFEDYLRENIYQAIIIDVHNGIMSGFEVREDILSSNYYNDCPIIFKTSYDSDENIEKGLSSNCEYITPEMKPDQIRLRIKNQIDSHPVKYFGGLRFDVLRNEFNFTKKEMKLTPTEFNIIRLLFMNSFSISKELLIESIWPNDKNITEDRVHTHVSNTRNKIDKFNIQIKSNKEEGYYLELIQDGKN